MELEGLSSEEFAEYLSAKFPSDVVDSIKNHGLDGAAFLLMGEEHIKEVAPRIVDRINLKKLQSSCKAQPAATPVQSSPVHIASTMSTPTTPELNSKHQSLPSTSPGTSSSFDWHHSFVVPCKFSTATEEAIKSGKLTRSCRTEIVQAISTAILVYTKQPSKEQYNTVCQKLIEKFPTLKDAVGTTGYGSWKEKLRDRFKFLRRPKAGEPPRKRQRECDGDNGDDTIDLEADLAQLKAECCKRKKNRCMATVQNLTDGTYSARRKWIKESQPSVLEVIDKYPSLKYKKIITREFKAIVGLDQEISVMSYMESWPLWKTRIVAYSNLEKTNRSKIRQLLLSLQEDEVDKDTIALQLLSELLIPKTRTERLIYIIKSSEDVSAAAKSTGANYPLLCVNYSPEDVSFHIIVEQEPIIEVSSFVSALVYLMACYYIYDIAYPKPLNSLLLLIQHHIFEIHDSCDSVAVIQAVTSFKNMDN